MLYEIVSSYDKTVVERKVKELIIMGWKLQGGIGVGYSGAVGGALYSQAMTFEEGALRSQQQSFVDSVGI
jgi:hypothetical protein